MSQTKKTPHSTPNKAIETRPYTQLFLPTTSKEIKALGWDYIDVIIFTGDAYIDHPSFGAAVIGRTLQNVGYRVAIVPQPNWQDDLRDFKKLGEPRLFFGVTAGAMDSMVNHYTATKRLRSNDPYTPEDRAGARPDYPTIVYSKILKQLYPNTLIVIGGIEASLRRLTHYDYWQNKLRPSILIDSQADILVYGMGEKPIIEIAAAIKNKQNWQNINQICYKTDHPKKITGAITLHSFEECVKSKKNYAENFVTFETHTNIVNPATLFEQTGKQYIVMTPANERLTTKEIDNSFDLPYTRLAHPRYKNKPISAFEMIKDSVNIHRGCFGGCSFCAIAAHQGKFISSRSEKSIMSEIKKITQMSGFKGNLSDVGGPSANMWQMEGRNNELCNKCKRASCLFPRKCPNINDDHSKLLELYNKITDLPKIKHIYINSGIRYDLLDDKTKYIETIIEKHTSGRLKVAPEHTDTEILKLMRKPPYALFEQLVKRFNKTCSKNNLPYQIVPYFISSHPGCTMQKMKELKEQINLPNVFVEPVQDFTPTPMTLSTAMYYLEENPYTGEKLYVEKTKEKKDAQKNYFFIKKTSEQYNPKQKSSAKHKK